jgi:hypothetical protein
MGQPIYWVWNRTRNRWATSKKLTAPTDILTAEKLWLACLHDNPNCTYEIRTYPDGAPTADDAPVTKKSKPEEAQCKLATCQATNDVGVRTCWRCGTEDPCPRRI